MIQLQFLNYLLDSKDYSIIELNNLDYRYFSDYTNEFSFIKKHYEQYGNVPDKVTFLNSFSDFEIIQVSESSQYLLQALIDDYNTRKLTESFNKVRKLLMEDDNVNKAIDEYKKIQEQLTSNVVMQPIDLITDKKRYDDYIARTMDFNKFYIKTGFKELDNAIGGFDREEELAIIVARTNYGKSWIALKCAVAAAQQGLKVGFYSGEMSERKVGYRFDTILSHFNNGSLIHGNISIQNEYKKYIDDLPNNIKGSFKILTPLMINGPATVNALRMFIQREQLDILFVDQLSLIEDQRYGKSTPEKMSNISKDLKNLQVMERIPIVAVCQQNRTKNEDGSIDTTQIAQSDRIGQDATLVLFIDRPKNTELMKLIIGKSRDSGEVGKELSYHIDLNTGTFTFIPEGEDTQLTIDDEDLENRYESENTGGDVF